MPVINVKPQNKAVLNAKPQNQGLVDHNFTYIDTRTIQAGGLMGVLGLTYPNTFSFQAPRL